MTPILPYFITHSFDHFILFFFKSYFIYHFYLTEHDNIIVKTNQYEGGRIKRVEIFLYICFVSKILNYFGFGYIHFPK